LSSFVQEVADFAESCLIKASRSQGRSADADTAGSES
jgi:hypothetical protein